MEIQFDMKGDPEGGRITNCASESVCLCIVLRALSSVRLSNCVRHAPLRLRRANLALRSAGEVACGVPSEGRAMLPHILSAPLWRPRTVQECAPHLGRSRKPDADTVTHTTHHTPHTTRAHTTQLRYTRHCLRTVCSGLWSDEGGGLRVPEPERLLRRGGHRRRRGVQGHRGTLTE